MPNIDFSNLSQISFGKLTLETLLGALLTLLVCLVAIRLLTKAVSKLLQKPQFDPRLRKFGLSGFKALLYIITVLMVTDALGIPVTSLVTILGVFGLAVSLAVQDVLSNVASGLVILFSKPFMIGDYIESDVGAGTVASIDLVHTKLDTADGQRVLLPNSKLVSSKITNFTGKGQRRINIDLGASYDAAPAAVREACLKAISRTPNVLEDPAPKVVLKEFGASSMNYSVRCWTTVEDYWDSYFALMEELKSAMDAAGIAIPFDQLDVHIVDTPKA